jgi:hypothetical protein
MVFDPHRPTRLIVEKISDYQIQVLLLLQLGCIGLTTEGKGFKAWFEDMNGKKVDFSLRKDTLGNLYGLGLLRNAQPNRHGVFPYKLSHKGLEVLNKLTDARKAPNIKRVVQVPLTYPFADTSINSN